jgi:hypothetical protein
MAVTGRSTWNTTPRVPLELLDDTAARGLRLDQLGDLIQLWILERPTAPVPKTLAELEEVLLA